MPGIKNTEFTLDRARKGRNEYGVATNKTKPLFWERNRLLNPSVIVDN